MKLYNLTLTETQVEVLWKALDLYARIGIGQLEAVCYCHEHRDQYLPNREAAEAHLAEVKLLLTGCGVNSSFGITSDKVPDTYRVAFDMHNVIRHALSWEKNSKVSGVYREKPIQWGKEPMANLVIARKE